MTYRPVVCVRFVWSRTCSRPDPVVVVVVVVVDLNRLVGCVYVWDRAQCARSTTRFCLPGWGGSGVNAQQWILPICLSGPDPCLNSIVSTTILGPCA